MRKKIATKLIATKRKSKKKIITKFQLGDINIIVLSLHCKLSWLITLIN